MLNAHARTHMPVRTRAHTRTRILTILIRFFGNPKVSIIFNGQIGET